MTLQSTENLNYPSGRLKVTRRGVIGKMLLDILPRVQLSSTGTPGTAPSLTVESRERDDMHFAISTGQAEFDGNRYVIPEIVPNAPIESFSLKLAGSPLVAMDLRSGARPRTRAELTFKTQSGELPLLSGTQTVPPGVTLVFTRAVNPDLRLENKSADGTIPDRKVDLTIETRTAAIHTIGIVGDPGKKAPLSA